MANNNILESDLLILNEIIEEDTIQKANYFCNTDDNLAANNREDNPQGKYFITTDDVIKRLKEYNLKIENLQGPVKLNKNVDEFQIQQLYILKIKLFKEIKNSQKQKPVQTDQQPKKKNILKELRQKKKEIREGFFYSGKDNDEEELDQKIQKIILKFKKRKKKFLKYKKDNKQKKKRNKKDRTDFLNQKLIPRVK
jgi:hypothetical protein